MLLSATRIADESDRGGRTVFSLSADMAVHGRQAEFAAARRCYTINSGDLVIYTSITHSPKGDVCPSADYD